MSWSIHTVTGQNRIHIVLHKNLVIWLDQPNKHIQGVLRGIMSPTKFSVQPTLHFRKETSVFWVICFFKPLDQGDPDMIRMKLIFIDSRLANAYSSCYFALPHVVPPQKFEGLLFRVPHPWLPFALMRPISSQLTLQSFKNHIRRRFPFGV
jgi:hypothetical protein